MDSDNGVKRLLAMLEPLVLDLDDCKMLLSKRKEELENVSRFLAYTKDNYEMVGIYADQDLIINSFSELGFSNEEYKASCYLLKSEDENVKNLPQYEEAQKLIGSIIEYFVQHKAQLQKDIDDLSIEYQRKKIEKKYYDILSSEKPFVENVDEFKNFIDTHRIKDEDKIEIINYVLINNISNYESGNK